MAEKQNLFSVNFDPSGLNAALDEIKERAGEHIRAAAQAGAQVLYEEARLRAPVGDHAHFFYGTNQKYLFQAGTLRDSIYQVFSSDNSAAGQRATYHVSWNHFKCPYGYMVEFGTSRAPAHPFLRPAFDAARDESLRTANDEFVFRMSESLAKVKA